MIIIPAVDIRGGKCVRLVRGNPCHQTVYSDAPAAMAKLWVDQGAERLHLVDLDGAFEGGMRNQDIILDIISQVDIPVEVGGGIRDLATVEFLIAGGVYRIIIGTGAVEDKIFLKTLIDRWPDKISVGIDSINGNVAVDGWTKMTTRDAGDFAAMMQSEGVTELVVTDITQDGTLNGPNLDLIRHTAQKAAVPIIASGGVSSVDDIISICDLGISNVTGLIIGKALYSGDVKLSDALKIAKGEKGEN